MPRPQIVILAAGFSSRLGSPKALARIHGTSLLRRTLQRAAGLTPGRIMVIVPKNAWRHRWEARGLPAAFVTNRQRASGLSSSVRRAIAGARYSTALLLLPVDLAALRRRDLARLLSRWRSARRRVTAARMGDRAGIPLVLPHWLYARALAVSGDRGLGALVNDLPAHQRVLLELPSAVSDVDTPSDLQEARRRLKPATLGG